MTKEELLNQFKTDVDGLTGSPMTDPMNTRHAHMYEAYKLGYDLGKKSAPVPREIPQRAFGEPMKTVLNRRISKHFGMQDTLVAYLDEYNNRLRFRWKISKTCEEDIHTKRIGAFTDIDTAKRVLGKYV